MHPWSYQVHSMYSLAELLLVVASLAVWRPVDAFRAQAPETEAADGQPVQGIATHATLSEEASRRQSLSSLLTLDEHSMQGTQSDKEITYMRHGESAGNAGVWGMLEKMSFTAYKDGELVNRGENQVVDRVATMNCDFLKRIASAEVVLVSPLQRAIVTAIIAVAEVHARMKEKCDEVQITWPKFEVMAELREKVESASEQPGTGTDPMEYARIISEKYGELLFHDTNAMRQIVDDIDTSYLTEKKRTNDWQPEPNNGLKFIDMIKAGKARIQARSETKLLLVAHSGWARFAFSPFLPAVLDDSADIKKFDAAVKGARHIVALHNAGVVKANLANGLFHSVQVDGQVPGSDELPNCRLVKWGMFVSVEEAVSAGVLGGDVQLDRAMCRLAGWLGDSSKLVTFSLSDGRTQISWGNRWGEPRAEPPLMDLATTRLQRSSDTEIVLEHANGIVTCHMETVEDSARFETLFARYSSLR